MKKIATILLASCLISNSATISAIGNEEKTKPTQNYPTIILPSTNIQTPPGDCRYTRSSTTKTADFNVRPEWVKNGNRSEKGFCTIL